MLKDLKILNGNLDLTFNPLNTIYTITVSSEVNSLEIEYELEENTSISVFGNALEYGTNEVVLTVYNDEEMESYYIYVYREEVTETMQEIENLSALNIEKKEVSEYAAPGISVICFLIILFSFVLLFKKRKKI